jgi:hypothetical protein
MTIDQKFLVWALGYAVAGMGLGIFMAASHDHSQHVTHAHTLLVGFVLSLAYGVIHRLWLDAGDSRVAKLQFVVHHAGALTMIAGLFLLYGDILPLSTLDPVLATASIAVLAGALLMLYLALSARRTVAPV